MRVSSYCLWVTTSPRWGGYGRPHAAAVATPLRCAHQNKPIFKDEGRHGDQGAARPWQAVQVVRCTPA